MPRFFFNVDGEQPDVLGVELPDAGTARGEAIRAAGEILRDIDGAFVGQEWIMRVYDGSHNCMLKLRFTVQDRARHDP